MTRNAKANIALAVEAVLLCVIVFCVWHINGTQSYFAESFIHPIFNHVQDPNQYAYLADALMHGRVWLDLPVAEGLRDATNPYDFSVRYALGANGERIFWDYAYFDGKYYCYFGVIPAVLLYLPYQLLTGEFLNTSYACVFLALLVVVAAAYFARRIVKGYFATTADGFSFCLALLLLFFGSNVWYFVSAPCFYSIPYLSSLIFTFLGLGLWLAAKGDGRHSRLSGWRLFFGSLCMAMNLGCRPHFMLACFLAIPLFWSEIRHKRIMFSKHGINNTICALLPFVLVSAPLLAYNYVRFGSFFDLGSQYNLTGYDMGGYVQNPLATAYLVYQYLIQPMHFSSAFPFVESVNMSWPFAALHDVPISVIAYMLPAFAVCVCVLFMSVRGIVRAKISFRILCLGAIILLCIPIAVVLTPIMFAGSDALVSGVKEALSSFAPHEPWYGGLLWFLPCNLLLLFVPKAYRYLRSTAPPICGLMACCFVFASVALLVDAHMCGLTMRYWGDFGWYLAIVCIFIFMSSMAQRAEAIEGESFDSALSERPAQDDTIHITPSEREARAGESDMKKRRGFTSLLFDARVLRVLVIVSLAIALLFEIAWVFSSERYYSILEINPVLWSMIVG